MPGMNALMERWAQTCRRELPGRTLVWNHRHRLRALREFEQFCNSHRPHRGIANARPLHALPPPIPRPTAATRLHIHRHDRLGGILHEYQHAALPAWMTFSASTGLINGYEGPHKDQQLIQKIAGQTPWASLTPHRSAVHVSGRLKAAYHRLVTCFGGYRNPAARKRAIVAIAHTLAAISWQMLATGSTYTDLGGDFYARHADPGRETSRLLARLKPSARESPSNPPDNFAVRNPAPPCAAALRLGPVSY
jgi:hypothetical protein